MRAAREVTKTFASFAIRIVTIDGNPWFVGIDVCRVLSITNAGNAYSRLGDGELTYIRQTDVGLPGGRDMALLSESGLYKLVLRSDKPQARQFQDWVTRDVLPAIRKDGGYILGEEKVKTGELSEDELQSSGMASMVSVLAARVRAFRSCS